MVGTDAVGFAVEAVGTEKVVIPAELAVVPMLEDATVPELAFVTTLEDATVAELAFDTTLDDATLDAE